MIGTMTKIATRESQSEFHVELYDLMTSPDREEGGAHTFAMSVVSVVASYDEQPL